ncbi:MAG: PAS domain S-box protein [Microscillaceae bacterium]|nr:PAS domain S-box protein [Microscillaceae bacterium]
MIKKEEIIPLLPTYLLNSKIYSLVITDLEGNYVFVNEVFKKKFSFVSEDLIGLPFLATVHPEDIEKCNQAAYACIINPDLTLEVDIRKPKQDNQDYYWTSWEFSLFKNKQNQAIGIIAIGYDITPQKALEKDKQLLSERFEKIVENIPSFVYQFCIRPEGTSFFPYASPQSKALLGVSPELLQISDADALKLVHPDDLDILVLSMRESAETLTPWKHEWRTLINGKVQWLGGSSTPQKMDDGSIVFYGYIQDITNKKLAEQALVQSKNTLKETIDNAPGAFYQYIIDPDGHDRIFNINRGLYEIWEISQEDIKQKPNILWDAIHPDDLEITRKSVKESAQTLKPWDWQFRIIPPSGKVKWLYGRGTPHPQPGGAVMWYVFVTDVTARNQAQQELEKIQALLSETGRIAKIGGWELDIDTDVITWTPEVYRIYGVDVSYEPNRIQDMIPYPPDDRELLRQNLDLAIQSGRSFDLELRLINEQNQLIWVNVKGKAIFKDYKAFKLVGTIQDITERKQAEQKIRDSEIKLKAIYNSSSEQNLFISPQYKILSFNQAVRVNVEKIHQKEIQEGQSILDYIFDVDKLSYMKNFNLALLGETIQIEREINFGTFTQWFQASYFPVYDQENKLIGVANNFRNISERKKAEKYLLESKERFRNMIESSPVPKFMMDAQANIIFISQAFIQTYGYDSQDIPDFESWQQLAYPDPVYRQSIKNIWNKQWEALVKKAQTFENIELNIRCKDGSMRVVMAGVVWLEGDPDQYSLITLYDITEIKKYEQKILSQNKNLKIIAWMQSHQVRKPLSTMMGLIKLIQDVKPSDKEVYLTYLYETAKELDEIIHEIVHKTEKLDDQDQDDVLID